MTSKPSIINRIAIGKSIGFLLSLIGIIIIRLIGVKIPLSIEVGFILWYITFGAIIGIFGIFTWHPILKIKLPWWIRSSIIGAWLNFVLLLITYDTINNIIILNMVAFFGDATIKLSPFWFVAEGAIVALIMDYFATKFGKEGKKTLVKDKI